jgi:hypothetical protein
VSAAVATIPPALVHHVIKDRGPLFDHSDLAQTARKLCNVVLESQISDFVFLCFKLTPSRNTNRPPDSWLLPLEQLLWTCGVVASRKPKPKLKAFSWFRSHVLISISKIFLSQTPKLCRVQDLTPWQSLIGQAIQVLDRFFPWLLVQMEVTLAYLVPGEAFYLVQEHSLAVGYPAP